MNVSLRVFLIGSVIVLAAVLVRFINLDSLPIFADEAIYVRWSQVMRAESSLRFLPLSDGKQPLFMWATIPVFKIISDPLLAGRVLSGLSGLGIVIGIFVGTQWLFKNSKISLTASAVAALLPYLVFFDRMALSDSMLTMFVVWTFNFFLYAVTHDRWDWSMMAGFSLGFAWLTKSPAIFSFVLLPLLIIFSQRKKKAIFYLLTTYILATGMYNILRLGPEFHMISLRNKDYVFSVSEVLRRPLDPLIPHLKDSLNFYWYFMTPVGLVLAFGGILVGREKFWKEKIILVSWAVIPILIQSMFAKQFTARYLLFTVPFAIMLAALAIDKLGKKALVLLLVYAAILDYQLIYTPQNLSLPRIERSGYLEGWTAGFGIKNISQEIRKAAQNGPVVVGSEGFFGTPFDGLQLYLNDVSNVRVIGVGIAIDHVNERLVSALKDNKVYLVVNSTRFHGQADELGLKLLASYPKAQNPSGSRESLLFFEVLPR